MTDKDIQQAVLRELEWEPMVKSTEIGVAVKDGIVTLAGYVDSYSKRYRAELKDNPAVAKLRALKGKVTLIYGARDPTVNHAAVLAKFLKR